MTKSHKVFPEASRFSVIGILRLLKKFPIVGCKVQTLMSMNESGVLLNHHLLWQSSKVEKSDMRESNNLFQSILQRELEIGAI